MQTIEIIYLTTTFVSVVMAIPQLKQLLVLKNSDEFNLYTWLSWMAAQTAALFYSITLNSIPYMAVNIVWLFFYVAMISLIIKYRKQPVPVLVETEPTQLLD